MRVRRSPPWLASLIDELCAPGSRVLWVGPPLTLSTASRISLLGASDPVPDGPFDGVFLAWLAGEELSARLRALRAACAPGAALCLLLPETRDELGARMRRLFDPLGSADRQPRSLPEQCGALLAVGASGVASRRHAGQLRCVTAHLPTHASDLDAMFASPGGTRATP